MTQMRFTTRHPFGCIVTLAVLLNGAFAWAQDFIHFNGPVDGTDRVTFTQDSAVWQHISRGISTNPVYVNSVEWRPKETNILWNSGATTFLTNSVDFLTGYLDVISSRDTLVLEVSTNTVVITVADTPNGEDQYEFYVRFSAIPELHIKATIDGSDEVHISRYGARWLHKQWGWPSDVSLNGVDWNPSTDDYLSNTGSNQFIEPSVDFCSAVVITNSGRDASVVESSEDGLVIHFADNPNGASPYEVSLRFPWGVTNILSRPTIAATNGITLANAAAINFHSTSGQLYELQYTHDLSSSNWVSSGTFLVGDGGDISFYDPAGYVTSRFYRVISTPRMR